MVSDGIRSEFKMTVATELTLLKKIEECPLWMDNFKMEYYHGQCCVWNLVKIEPLHRELCLKQVKKRNKWGHQGKENQEGKN